ncbi:MAG: hypothetical protein QW177_08020 [Candidatus Nitrosotenuis sp.]
MGATHKGKGRQTAFVSRRTRIIPLILSSLTTAKTATFPSDQSQKLEITFQKIPAAVLVNLLITIFPQFIPLIYIAYMAYKLLDYIIRQQKEYRNLKHAIMEEESLIEIVGKYVLEKGIRRVTDKNTSEKIHNEINLEITNLVANEIFQQMIRKSAGKDQQRQEKFQNMLVSTLSQFIVGSLVGSDDELVIQAARILMEGKND